MGYTFANPQLRVRTDFGDDVWDESECRDLGCEAFNPLIQTVDLLLEHALHLADELVFTVSSGSCLAT